MTIFKVRFTDIMGKEVAEFGFYEEEGDARRRMLELASLVSGPGKLEIRVIDVVPSVEKAATNSGLEVSDALNYYALKKHIT